jgi:hypothetical protein
VIVTSTNVVRINAGGFVGNLKNAVTVEDSYALGNVTVDRSAAPSTAGWIYAGGFAGYLLPDSGKNPAVSRCFSKGLVSAQTAGTSTVDQLYVGGMAGFIASGGTVKNCVSLGTSYIIAGGASSNRGIGRISSNTSGLSDNYACATQLYDGAYGSLNPGDATGSNSLGNGSTHKDGITVLSGTCSYQSFWTNTTSGSGPGFGTSRWSFSGIGSRGYPILAGVGGNQ